MPAIVALLCLVLARWIVDISTAARSGLVLCAGLAITYAYVVRAKASLALFRGHLQHTTPGRKWDLDLAIVKSVRNRSGPKSTTIELTTEWGQVETFALTKYGSPEKVARALRVAMTNAEFDSGATQLFKDVEDGLFNGRLRRRNHAAEEVDHGHA